MIHSYDSIIFCITQFRLKKNHIKTFYIFIFCDKRRDEGRAFPKTRQERKDEEGQGQVQRPGENFISLTWVFLFSWGPVVHE